MDVGLSSGRSSCRYLVNIALIVEAAGKACKFLVVVPLSCPFLYNDFVTLKADFFSHAHTCAQHPLYTCTHLQAYILRHIAYFKVA